MRSAVGFGAALFVGLSALPMLAETYSVQDLLHDCEATPEQDAFGSGVCVGLIMGLEAVMETNCALIADGVAVPEHLAASDVPSVGAGMQAFENWAKANPRAWGVYAPLGAARSLAETFPCPG